MPKISICSITFLQCSNRFSLPTDTNYIDPRKMTKRNYLQLPNSCFEKYKNKALSRKILPEKNEDILFGLFEQRIRCRSNLAKYEKFTRQHEYFSKNLAILEKDLEIGNMVIPDNGLPVVSIGNRLMTNFEGNDPLKSLVYHFKELAHVVPSHEGLKILLTMVGFDVTNLEPQTTILSNVMEGPITSPGTLYELLVEDEDAKQGITFEKLIKR